MNIKNLCGGATLSLVLMAAAVMPNKAHAAAGDLDPTFGTNGKVTTDFSGNLDLGNAAAVQSDRKIVVAGFTRVGSNQTTEDFALARYNVDGSLDSTFGTGGKVIGGFFGTPERANAVAIQSDGKIIAAGSSESFFALIRLNPDGSVDTSFGTFGDGIVRTMVAGGGAAQVNAIAIQSDGKILAAGRAGDASNNTLDFAVLRYNTNGTLDTGFGTGGGTNTDFFSGNDAAFSIVLQPDGKIVAAGSASRGDSTSPDFALVRLNANGSLDGTFGSGGKVTTDFSSSQDGIYSIALQPDGKIVAAGFTFIASQNNDNFGLARYNTDGALDTSFGSGGKVITDFSPTTDEAHAVIVQPDGRIVAAGIADVTGNALDFALARYNSNGSLDSNFGASGKVTTVFTSTADFVNALVLQFDDKLVAVGGSNSDFALARYSTGLGVAPSQLLNIATRLRVQTGENVLIGGFIITGTDSKTVIIRGIGPSLAQFLNGALANPTLELFQGSTLLASNNDWKDSQRTEIEATGIPPSNDFESAIVRTLPPGSYTAILRGMSDTTGIGIVEAYDLNAGANSKLANIATRGFVETGDNVMIGGLIVGPNGSASARVVARAIGPTLSDFGIAGALQDPMLDLVNSNGVVLRSNNDWRDSQQTEIEATGLQPSDIREAALVETLGPGAYTAIVRGAGNTTGVGLVEVYNVQ